MVLFPQNTAHMTKPLLVATRGWAVTTAAFLAHFALQGFTLDDAARQVWSFLPATALAFSLHYGMAKLALGGSHA